MMEKKCEVDPMHTPKGSAKMGKDHDKGMGKTNKADMPMKGGKGKSKGGGRKGRR